MLKKNITFPIYVGHGTGNGFFPLETNVQNQSNPYSNFKVYMGDKIVSTDRKDDST